MIPIHNKESNRYNGFLFIFTLNEKLKIWFRFIISDRNSKNIFLYLLLNIIFASFELYSGLVFYSFELIRDSFHILFDCIGYVIGLYASIVIKYKQNAKYSFGYGRAEIIAGFTNCTFLIFIVLYNIRDVIHFSFESSEVKHDCSFFVFTLFSLLINVTGINMFRGTFFWNNSNDITQNRSNDTVSKCNSHKIMRSVFLHVLADTLLRLSKIISAVLLITFGWEMAELICSFCVLSLIAASVSKLMYETCSALMQRRPIAMDKIIPECNKKVAELAGVQKIIEQHFWTLCSDFYVGTILLEVTKNADSKYVVSHTQMIFSKAGCQQLYVELQFHQQNSSTV